MFVRMATRSAGPNKHKNKILEKIMFFSMLHAEQELYVPQFSLTRFKKKKTTTLKFK